MQHSRMSHRLLLPAIAVVVAQATAFAQNQKLEIVKLAENVYAGVYSEIRMDPVEGNSLIVVGGDGVLVLDSGRTPDSARAMMAEIRKLTDKPVRFLVNSHWHDDHIFGNQAYQEAFPDVRIIAHRNTREDMQQQVVPSLTKYGVEYWQKMAAGLEGRLAKGVRSDGTPLTDQQRTQLKEQLRTLNAFIPKLPSLRVVLPAVTIDGTMSVYQQEREIQLMHPGLGNTRGDLAVYLPKERILATGDLLVHPVPFAYGSFISEWIESLKKLRRLDVKTIVPGHGPLMHGPEYLDEVIKLLETLVGQVNDAVKRGLTLEETRKAVNLDAFRQGLAGDDPVRGGVFADSIMREAVERAYKAAKGELNR